MSETSQSMRLAVGDSIEVFDWHPNAPGGKWQAATIERVDGHQMDVRLKEYGGVVTVVNISSDAWRPTRSER